MKSNLPTPNRKCWAERMAEEAAGEVPKLEGEEEEGRRT
jgi:hypothetical protein